MPRHRPTGRGPVLDRRLPDDGLPAWTLASRQRPRRLPVLPVLRGLAVVAAAVGVLVASGVAEAAGAHIAELHLDHRQETLLDQAQVLVVLDGGGQLTRAALEDAAGDVPGAAATPGGVQVTVPWSPRCRTVALSDGQPVVRDGRRSDGRCEESAR